MPKPQRRQQEIKTSSSESVNLAHEVKRIKLGRFNSQPLSQPMDCSPAITRNYDNGKRSFTEDQANTKRPRIQWP